MSSDAPIAVIGLSYRAPGVGRKGLWEYLAQARSAWTNMPADRFDQSAYFRAAGDKSGVMRVRGAHFVDNVYGFDAAFFNMRAEEAKNSDPQHRMMLECAFEAAEDAGLSMPDLAGRRIGVFVGSGQHEYSQRLGDDEFSTHTFSGTGVAPCMAANRISYFFDIDGPSVVTDAACASSVYAAHVAVSALRNHECEAAFVGSSSLNLGPGGWIVLEKTGALSDHGRSYSYDEKATGFGRGEGAACLLVKRLDDAIRDGDPIHALIRNSACNHGGRSEGITMPNGLAQQKLLWAVHKGAGLDPSDTPVVEGHGTGTAAGDPIEAGAFTAVLGRDRTAENPLYLGSIKSNFGHLEGASGILAMVKAIMMVEHGVVLPTAGFEKINPKIGGAEKIRIAETPLPWPKGEPRRAIVTNFGFGGSNSAIILEAAPDALQLDSNGATSNGLNGHGSNGTDDHHTNGTDDHHTNGTNGHDTNGSTKSEVASAEKKLVFAFSAKTEKSLAAYLASFDEYLDETPDTEEFAKDLSYTLGKRRTNHAYRAVVAAESIESLQEKLTAAKPTRIKDRTIAFAFTGQGAQHAQMASGLRRFKVFAEAMDEAEQYLQEMGSSWSLSEELAKPASESRVDAAEISQPACTCVQLALVALLKSWEIAPSAVAGHSSGEIAAAFAAGLVSFKAAVAIAYFRGKSAAQLLRQQASKGAMLALGVGEYEAGKLIDEHAGGYATVAAINSPKSVTISGDQSAIDNVLEAAEKQGLFARKLKVEMAYHSRHMEEVASSYLEAIRPYCDDDYSFVSKEGADTAGTTFISSVTAEVTDEVDASYWVKNLVRPVRFSDAIQGVFTSTPRGKVKSTQGVPNVVIEIGPHPALKNPIKQSVDALQLQGKSAFAYLPSLTRDASGADAMVDMACSLFTMGAPINIGGVNQTDKTNAKVVYGVPAYQWDKSISYELKPRPTHEKLFPGEPYHDLLGRRMVSNGGKERAWRQVFTLDEMPWIRDHVVAGATIFPMTAYMSCAIQAARLTSSQPAAAFLVKDFHVIRSLEIQEEQEVEITTRMRPAALGEGTFSSTIWTFEICSWFNETGWTVHAYGQIEPEMADMTMETPTFQASLPLVGTTADMLEHDIENTYADAGVRATRYGPTFRNNVRFWEGKGYTVLEHRLRDLGAALDVKDSRGSPVSTDPPTLDGFLQGGGPLQVDEDGRRPAQMPNYISRFRVSNKIPSAPKTRFDVVMRRLDYDVKGGRMHVGVAAFAHGADGKLTPVAEWESAAFRSIGSADENIDPAADVPDNWAWEFLPRYDFLPLEQVRRMLSVGSLGEEEAVRSRKLEEAACWYIKQALEETAGVDYTALPPFLQRFVHWGAETVTKYRLDFPEEPTELLNDVRSHDAQGELLCLVGEQIPDILRGEVETLEIMLAEGRLTRHYEADVVNAHLSQILGDLADNLSNLEPNLKILEVGGGTAGTTLPVMEGLSRGREEPGFLNYTFTDISTGFFEMARSKLSRWQQRITYKKLDITVDPSEQGFAAEDYDIVIAANVLHATADMVSTMKNVRSLLKPGGKIFLLEANMHPPSVLPFSLLPGWWAAEDEYRDHAEGPMMPVTVWDRLLQDSGFSGVDHAIPGVWDAEVQLMSIMTSTKVNRAEGNQSITICGPFIDDDEVEYAQMVADAVADQLGCETETRPFAELDVSEAPYYIFIDSKNHSVMQNPTPETFEGVKSMLLNNAGLIWVTPEAAAPDAQIITGLLRTLRMEVDVKNLLHLDRVPSTPEGLSGILKLAAILRNSDVRRDQDQDYVWHNGSVHLPRLRQLRKVKEQFAVEQGISFRKEQNIWDGDRALEMTINAAGSPDSIYFRRTDTLQQPLGDDEVLIRVAAAGVSYRDLSLVLGAIPWAPPGFDGAGRVVKAGARVSHLREGDSVFFLALDSSAFSTYKRMPAWHVARIPAGISMTDAAGIPLAYSLAVLALCHTARLRKNETVLIHSATGAVGQACVALAQHLGARVFATAGTEAKREYLHTEMGIPKGRIFSSRTPEFRDSILCATGNKGVDVIVSSLGGELMTETWSLAASFGRFVDIGKKDAFQNNNLPMRPFDSNVTFSGVDIRELYRHKPDDMRDVFAEVVSLLQRNIIGPIQTVTTFPISQFGAALRKLKGSETIGKLVVTLDDDECVMAESSLRPSEVSLRADATYLVTGGTRGIGLDLAYWMIDHGARNLVLLGRSGATGPEVQKLLKKCEGTDVCVRALACNVGIREELAAVVEAIKDMPPVKGVIHSALLLSDKLFENATHEDWSIVCTPRVQGAWNLQELMPNDLDFFVALSSFNGDTGNMGQAIYAGTAGFYDAFARARNARGQHTVSISLPIVLDVGYVADNNLGEILKQTLGVTLKMADIRTIFKGAVAGAGSPFHTNGRATAFKLYVDGQPVPSVQWQYFHPVHTKERLKADRDSRLLAGGGAGGEAAYASWTAAADPLEGLTEALVTKVAAMTMMEREDVLPDTPLASYSLDSLVSVELRNWIRRETAVELTLGAITQADSLRALAMDILAQREEGGAGKA